MTPERLAEIRALLDQRDRLAQNGIGYSDRQIVDAARCLLAEVDRRIVKPTKVARWENSRRLRGPDGRAFTIQPAHGPVWNVYDQLTLVAVVATEPEARAYIEAEAARRGWTVEK